MPPFVDDAPLHEANFHRWAKDGDVVIASSMKSGTMLLHQIVRLLRRGGRDDDERLQNAAGTIELLKYPGHSLETRLAEQNAIRERSGLANQQWFTHQTPDNSTANMYGLDPAKHPSIKYVSIHRNGKEVVRSAMHFFNAHSSQFRAMWGGFPPPVPSPEDALDLFTNGVPALYFEHVAKWWAVRNAPNVLMLHFTDVIADKPGTVKRLAEFLGIELSEDLLAAVVEKSSHAYMQKRAHKFVVHFGRPGEEFQMVGEDVHIRKSGGIHSHELPPGAKQAPPPQKKTRTRRGRQ